MLERYKGQPILRTFSFKYLGSFVSSHELLLCLEDCLVRNAGKAYGAVRPACRSAVALPVSRLVYLHKSLVSPIALLNCVAWFPFLEQTGKWYAAQQAQWWFFLGFKARPSKEYLISCWLNFEPWEVSGALQVLNFTSQMTRAPQGLFLAALLVELNLECMRSPKAWLFSALRVLSKGIYIPKEGSLLDRVEKLLDRIRENKISY